MDGTAADVGIILLVVGLRLVVPLFVPVFPLPAIVACLVIDGVDQTVFQTQLSPPFWAQVENGYQGYDKALDVYYLSVAYAATLRNWTNPAAVVSAQFLWLYRLAGVTLFELVHDAGEPASWRWLLLVFPNTFEYFFIAYEAIRLRWDPARIPGRAVVGLVVAIWVLVKLPQEWWIHVARLDFTDVAAANAWVLPVLGLAVAGLCAGGWWAVTHRLPPADHPPSLLAPPLPEELDTAAERSAFRALNWRMLDANLAQKVALVGLVCIDFAQILPGSTMTPLDTVVSVGVLLVVNSAVGLALARRSRSIERTALAFLAVCGLNALTVAAASLLSRHFHLDHALFFVLLISLIVVLYDRYRPVRDLRMARAGAVTA
ncbi:hypothetical protein [Kineosporia sp. R_H_3]|uniref:hypothetical protein n=1 Tax=Kineosporia sp. R_H_3 TaxID=1961848 RepID=UPI000B4B5638|nr:hypothetical protein [Kineosporia sp. R_H_3]